MGFVLELRDTCEKSGAGVGVSSYVCFICGEIASCHRPQTPQRFDSHYKGLMTESGIGLFLIFL